MMGDPPQRHHPYLLHVQDDYWVRKYAAITLSHGRLRRQFRRQATLTGMAREVHKPGGLDK